MARDVRKSEEWAQGFLFDYRSGYTEGTLGVGLDLLGKLGVRLDSGAGRSGTGLLPLRDDGSAAGDYARLDATAKLRLVAQRTEGRRPGTEATDHPAQLRAAIPPGVPGRAADFR